MAARRSTPRPALLLALLGLLAGAPADVRAQSDSVTAEQIGWAVDARTTVERFADAFVLAVRHWDVDAWSRMVAPDLVMMAPNGRVVRGREAFHDLWSRSFEGQTGRNPLQVTLQEWRVSGDLAFVRADYGPEDRDPVGHYVWLLERDERGAPWSLAWWIFNRRSPGDG